MPQPYLEAEPVWRPNNNAVRPIEARICWRSQGQKSRSSIGETQTDQCLCILPVSLLGEHGRDPSSSLAAERRDVLRRRSTSGRDRGDSAGITRQQTFDWLCQGGATRQQAAAVAACRGILSPHCEKQRGDSAGITTLDLSDAAAERPSNAAGGALRFRQGMPRVFQVLPPGTVIVGNGGAP